MVKSAEHGDCGNAPVLATFFIRARFSTSPGFGAQTSELRSLDG
jgi:hypothetical protein